MTTPEITRGGKGWQATKDAIAAGLCRDCREPRGDGGTKYRCAACKEKRNKYLASWRERQKSPTAEPDARPVRTSQGATVMRRRPAAATDAPVEIASGDNTITLRMKSRRTKPGATADPDWKADHWSCEIVASVDALQVRLGALRIPFSMGSVFEGRPPMLSEVLAAVADDTRQLAKAPTFAQWCELTRHDADSRRSERIYRAVRRHASGLARLIGSGGAAEIVARFGGANAEL